MKKKKNVFHRTDRRTDGRSTQNHSSEPHKKFLKKNVFHRTDKQTDRQTHVQLKTIVRNIKKIKNLS